MKIYILCLFLGITGWCCQEAEETASTQKDLRQIAWEYLSEEDQQSVINWQEAIVQPYDCCPYVINEEGEMIQLNSESQAVVFSTKDNALLGPIQVLIDARTRKVWGITPRL